MKSKYSLLPLVLGVGLTLALLRVLALSPVEGPALSIVERAADLTVCQAGPPTCDYASVQAAVDVASPGDIIKVAAGTYTDIHQRAGITQVVYISKTVTIRGGYTTADWATPDPAANPTTLAAGGLGRVISIVGNVTPTIEGFIITGGNAYGLGGGEGGGDAGGGIYCYRAHPVIVGNVITNNVVSSNDGVDGGGIYLGRCHRAVVSGNTIVSNTASTGGFGRGGGVSIDWSDAIVISGNTIMSNTASTSDLGFGGGLYLYEGNVTISGNTVVDNIGSTGTDGVGGGIWIEYGVVTISGNTLQGNSALGPNWGTGGGVYAVYGRGLTLEGNLLVNNAGEYGGAVVIGQGTTFTLTNNIVAHNRASIQGGGLWVYGSNTDPSTGTLLHNTIADNVGSGGEGLYVRDYSALTLTNTIIAGHTVGITNTNPAASTVTADHTLFNGNGIDYGSGVSSTNEVSGDPAFVNPFAWDYHLTPSSAAIDVGVDAGVINDIDGDPRPLGAGYDIGADEWDPSKPTPTFTPIGTPTPTSTPTSTPTPTPTGTHTPTPTPTVTPTGTPSYEIYLPIVLKNYSFSLPYLAE